MSLLPETLSNIVEGGREAVLNLVTRRTVEVDTGVSYIDTVADDMGIEQIIPSVSLTEASVSNEAPVPPKVEWPAIENGTYSSDYRAQREAAASALVEQAHRAPVASTEVNHQVYASAAPVSRETAPAAPLSAEAQARLAEAQRLLDTHFNQAV